MKEICVSAEHLIAAAPEQVYGYLADFREHHPCFLPPAFSDFQVAHGGVGEGTVASFRVRIGGLTRSMRIRVSEPEPGRVLSETDLISGGVTTFTVAPHDDGCSVRIETRWQARRGIRAWLESRMAPRLLRTLYVDELARLDEYARASRCRCEAVLNGALPQDPRATPAEIGC